MQKIILSRVELGLVMYIGAIVLDGAIIFQTKGFSKGQVSNILVAEMERISDV